MRHLTTEDLARLVDEPGTEEERAHLHECPTCAEAMEAMRAQVAALAELPDLAAPAHGWTLLEARMRREGLGAAGSRFARLAGPATRAAAAVALFVAGAATSALLRGPAPAAGAVEPRDVTEAAALLRDREAAYLKALTTYAVFTGDAGAGDPLNRLAALEGIVLTTRAALNEAPADPVINGYHLAALSQREAILREISLETGEEWF